VRFKIYSRVEELIRRGRCAVRRLSFSSSNEIVYLIAGRLIPPGVTEVLAGGRRRDHFLFGSGQNEGTGAQNFGSNLKIPVVSEVTSCNQVEIS
jgi:hypothetical protein